MFNEHLSGDTNDDIENGRDGIVDIFVEDLFGDKPMLTMDEFNKRMSSRHSWVFETDSCRKQALNYLKKKEKEKKEKGKIQGSKTIKDNEPEATS